MRRAVGGTWLLDTRRVTPVTLDGDTVVVLALTEDGGDYLVNDRIPSAYWSAVARHVHRDHRTVAAAFADTAVRCTLADCTTAALWVAPLLCPQEAVVADGRRAEGLATAG